MIRVNLLPSERRKAKGPAFGLQSAQKIALAGSLILLLACAFVGWRYWALGQDAAQVERDIEAQRREEQRLEQVIAEVRDFEARRERLQQRVTLIEELRRGQTGPVHILDEVSRALPDRLWLVSMGQREKDFTIEGRTTSLSVLSDFVANLEGSAWFTKPVEILDTQVDQTPAGDMVRFTVRATTQNPEGAVVTAAPAGRGAPPAR
jgi:type IV pilus assembly protein PilN